MNDTELGLLNPKLVAAIQERWIKTAVGALFVRLSGNRNDAGKLLAHLNKGQLPPIFWHFSIGEDYYVLAECAKERGPARVQLERLAGEARAWLEASEEGGAESAAEYVIGYSLLIPAEKEGGEELSVYQGLRAAVVQAFEGDAESVPASTLKSYMAYRNGYDATYEIGRLASPIPVFQVSRKVYEINDFFHNRNDEQGVVVVNGSRPVGLIMKEKLHQLLSGAYGLALYSNRELSRVMDASPLIVEEGLSVEQVAQQTMARDTTKMYDVVIITDGSGEHLVGATSIRSLLDCITALRTEAARTANPLTGLPGNESIQAKLQARMRRPEPFSIIYADIDYFKWYNDFFGFAQGDELIQYLARTLQSNCSDIGTANDFVGHVGGDDFIIVTEAKEPERLCKEIIREFDGGIRFFYEDTEIMEVHDREGRVIDQSGVSLSLALLYNEGSRIYSTEQISRLSASLKKRAKSIKGSSYVMDYLQ